MGEDIPRVTPLPPKTRVISAFRDPPEEEKVADYIPIGHLVKSSMVTSQTSFFGHTSLEFAERPPIPVNATDKSAGKLPGFKARCYRTEEQLQSRPTQVKPNASGRVPRVTAQSQSTHHRKCYRTSV
jgi:hypothetical protein